MSSRTKSPRKSFGPRIGQTARLWRRIVDTRLQPFGLTDATWLPLLHIWRATSTMRQKDLAASLTLESSSVVRLLYNLEAAGLVTREEDMEDRRAKAIKLTREGSALAAQLEDVSRRIAEIALQGVANEDIEVASRVLDQVCQNLSADLED